MHHDCDPSNINGWQIRKIDRLRVGNVQAMQGQLSSSSCMGEKRREDKMSPETMTICTM
jgi:hypothetical protein